MTDEQKRAIAIAAAKAQAVKVKQGDGGPINPELAEISRAGLAGELMQGDQLPRENQLMGGVLPTPRQAVRNLKENLLGDDDPNTLNRGEQIGTTLNKAGEAMTFGVVGDETSAAVESAIPGVDYEARRDHYRQQERNLERDNPNLALGAEVGGAVTGALMPAGAMGTLARGAGLLPRLGASIATGAAGGGTYGFAEGEGVADRTHQGKTGMKFGAIAGALAPAVGGMVQKAADSRAVSSVAKALARGARSTDDLARQAKGAYQAIDDANVQIRPEAFDRMRGQMTQRMTDVGLDELPGPGSLTPKASRVNQIAGQMSEGMGQEPTAALPFSSLDQLRRHAGTAAADTAAMTGRATPDARIGQEAISTIDDFVKNLGADDVTAGDLESLQTLIPKARDTYARMSRSRLLDDAMENSENYLSGRASGIRNQFRRILSNKKLSRGFSDGEKALMRRVAQGSFPEQLLYLAGSGLGNLGAIGLGSTLGPVGTMAGLGAAAGLRKGAETVAERNADLVRAVVASGGMKNLPVATDANRRIVESLMRRGAAGAAQ